MNLSKNKWYYKLISTPSEEMKVDMEICTVCLNNLNPPVTYASGEIKCYSYERVRGNEVRCNIFTSPVILQCGHIFHEVCIKKWFYVQEERRLREDPRVVPSCPNCNDPFTLQNIVSLDKYVLNFAYTEIEWLRTQIEDLVDERDNLKEQEQEQEQEQEEENLQRGGRRRKPSKNIKKRITRRKNKK